MTDAERKKAVAKSIFDGLSTVALASAAGVEERHVIKTRVDNLSVQIRVSTADSGVHYYLVKVSEQI